MWLYVPGISACSAESADSTCLSESQCQMLAASVMSKGRRMQPRYWRRAWKTKPWTRLLSTATCELFEANRGAERWISSLGDSPARTCPSQEKERASMDPVQVCGSSTCESFARYDLDSSSWRTCQDSSVGDSTLYLDRWPRSGSMRSGAVYPQKLPVPRIEEIDSSCSHTKWQTVTVFEGKVRRQGVTREIRQSASVEMLISGQAEKVCRTLWSLGVPSFPRAQKTSTRGSTPSTMLNPAFTEWMMGWPIGWTAFEPVAMESWLFKARQHFQFWPGAPE